MIKVVGKLVYDPERDVSVTKEAIKFKKVHKQRTLVVELPWSQLHLYYQWFLRKEFGGWFELQPPMYGLHVTVVKGDEHIDPKFLDLWKKYDGEEIEIEYDPTRIERHWKFWSITVVSPRLVEIRKELGLRIDFRLHLTIGRQYEWQPMFNPSDQLVRDVEYN